jgi:hypothetical protein
MRIHMKSKIAEDILALAGHFKAEKVTPFRRDEEGFATVTFKIKGDALHSLLKLLKQCEYNGNVGHSFNIEVDPHGGEDKRSVGFDGDGADKIKDILVNGKPLPDKFEW